jgi:predicted DNA-binding transcriptional regulator AlpA
MNNTTQNVLLNIQDVKRSIGFKSTTTVYALMREQAFPKPVTIGKTNRWLLAEVQGWIAARVTESREVQ